MGPLLPFRRGAAGISPIQWLRRSEVVPHVGTAASLGFAFEGLLLLGLEAAEMESQTLGLVDCRRIGEGEAGMFSPDARDGGIIDFVADSHIPAPAELIGRAGRHRVAAKPVLENVEELDPDGGWDVHQFGRGEQSSGLSRSKIARTGSRNCAR